MDTDTSLRKTRCHISAATPRSTEEREKSLRASNKRDESVELSMIQCRLLFGVLKKRLRNFSSQSTQPIWSTEPLDLSVRTGDFCLNYIMRTKKKRPKKDDETE